MAFLGLSGSTLTFLGGVAEGVSKTLDKQIDAQQAAIREASSTAIRARLASRKKYDSNIEKITKEIKPLLSQYNLPNVASLMALPEPQRKEIVSKLATIDGKDNRAKFFKAMKEFEGKTDLTESELINSLVPAYKESEIDYAGLVPKTFADVIFGQDPSDRLASRVKLGTGDLRPSVDRKDLTAYQQGLTRKGSIKVFAEDAKDVNNFRTAFIKDIFTRMGGKGVEDIGGGFRPEAGKEADLALSTTYVNLLIPQYNEMVRKLQIDEGLSLIDSQTKARSIVANNINSRYKIDDVAGNQNKIKSILNSAALQNPSALSQNSYLSILKGSSSDKVSLLGLLNYNENRFSTKYSKNESMGTDFRNEVEGELRERLGALNYSEDEIRNVLKVFFIRVRPYVTGGS